MCVSLRYLVLHASEAAQRLRGRVRGQRVGVPLHQRGLDARHGQQLRQLIDVEIAHACEGDRFFMDRLLLVKMLAMAALDGQRKTVD